MCSAAEREIAGKALNLNKAELARAANQLFAEVWCPFTGARLDAGADDCLTCWVRFVSSEVGQVPCSAGRRIGRDPAGRVLAAVS